MLLMTMIARIADGLPLAASMQEDEQVYCNCMLYFASRETPSGSFPLPTDQLQVPANLSTALAVTRSNGSKYVTKCNSCKPYHSHTYLLTALMQNSDPPQNCQYSCLIRLFWIPHTNFNPAFTDIYVSQIFHFDTQIVLRFVAVCMWSGACVCTVHME